MYTLTPPWDCDGHLPSGSGGRLFGSFLSLGGFVEIPNNCLSEFQWRHSGKPPKECVGCFTEVSVPPQSVLIASGLLCPFYHHVPSFFVDTVGHSVDRAGPDSASVITLLTLSPTGAGRNYLLKQSNESHLSAAPRSLTGRCSSSQIVSPRTLVFYKNTPRTWGRER